MEKQPQAPEAQPQAPEAQPTDKQWKPKAETLFSFSCEKIPAENLKEINKELESAKNYHEAGTVIKNKGISQQLVYSVVSKDGKLSVALASF